MQYNIKALPNMTQKEKKSLKEKIEKEIVNTKEQIERLKKKVEPIKPDCSLGRLTRLEAMGELHVNNKILDESKVHLTRLQNALLRIDKPMFGICIECEEQIGIGRMSIRPESVRCVECAENLNS
jgi:DnaK suppressor protein